MVKTLLFCFYQFSIDFITRFVVSFLLFYILFLPVPVWETGLFLPFLRKRKKQNRLSIQSDGAGDFFICLLFGNHFRQRIVRSLSARYSACPESGKTPFLKNERKIIYVRKAMRFAAYLLLIAACAAASLAIGTRNGEQDT